jgi:hypothetical protein
MNIDHLPPQYRPFKEIDIGTNRLVDGEVLFAINGKVPLLVGYGEIPRIWLSIPADPKGQTWQPLVRDNKSFHPKVKVNVEANSVSVDTPDGVVVRVEKITEELAKVVSINLRPFGINISGNENSLTVMNSNLSGNTFVKVKVMFGIGGGDKMGSM